MARIDGGGSRPVSAPKVESKPAPKAETKATPAPKNEAKTKQPVDSFEQKKPTTSTKSTSQATKAEEKPVGPPSDRAVKNFNRDTRTEIRKLANSDKATVTQNKDGSETRTKGSTHGGVVRENTLTEKKGLLREEQTKFTETTTRTKKNGNVDQEKNTASSNTDMFGRTTSSTSHETTTKRGATDSEAGQNTTTKNRTTDTDRWGNKKTTESTTKSNTKGTEDKNVTQSTTTSKTTDNFGNKTTSEEQKTVNKDGKTTVTTTEKKASGTELTTKSTAEFKDGTYSVGEQVDWSKKTKDNLKTKTKEIEVGQSTEDKGFTQQKKDDKLGNLQKAGDLAAAAGVKTKLWEGEIPKDKMIENNSVKGDPNTFVGNRYGYAGKGEVTLGADGLKANGNIEAKAGLYAEKKSDEIKKGEAGTQWAAGAKAEIAASAKGDATINANGLDASGSAKIGVTLEASVSGKAQTKSVKVAGVDVNASAEGSAKVSATAQAELTGKAKITRNPPTAILEGSAGASAVVKAEAEGKISAGPFSVKGNIYGSAGAEAVAKGSIGYEDGKIKISGSLGAAVGLGAGGGVAVEVDVKQIGEMAKNTAVKAADADGDGKLSMNDAKTVVNNVADAAKNTVNAAADKVKGWFGW